MTPASRGTTVTTADIVTLSVRYGKRRFDTVLPAIVPLAEVLPGLLQRLEILTPEEATAGFRILRSDGSTISQNLTLQEQEVMSGDTLTLESIGVGATDQRYDDLIEAVASAVEDSQSPWSPADSMVMSIASASLLFLTGAILLLIQRPGGITTPIGAAVGAIVILLLTAVISRSKISTGAFALAATACALAAVAGATALPESGNGLSLVLAGAATLITAALSCLALADYRESIAGPLVVGSCLLFLGCELYVLDLALTSATAILAATAAILLLASPWLALARTPLRIFIPRDQEQLRNDVNEIDADMVSDHTIKGHVLMLSFRIGCGLVILGTVPILAAYKPVGAALVAVIGISALLSTRTVYSRADVLTGIITGIAVLVVGGAITSVSQPDLVPVIIALAAIAGATVLALNVFSDKYRPGLERLADVLSIGCLLSIAPLAALVCGIV